MAWKTPAGAAEEIRAQKDAVMGGTWRHTYPQGVGEACLILRRVEEYPGFYGTVRLSDRATHYIWDAIRLLHPRTKADGPMAWNDWTGRKLGEMVEVLDWAEKLAMRDDEDDKEEGITRA